jgi:hypothetical protein
MQGLGLGMGLGLPGHPLGDLEPQCLALTTHQDRASQAVELGAQRHEARLG